MGNVISNTKSTGAAMGIVMVTGGAGFIGSHTCQRLLECGYSVVCIDSLNDYYSPAIKKANIAELEESAKRIFREGNFAEEKNNFFFYPTDILDVQGLGEIFRRHNITAIIHLAARAGVRPSLDNPQLYTDVNINGTISLLELSKKHGVKSFVFGSSSSVYGLNKKVPFSEEDSVESQTSPYGVSKRIGELYCNFYHKAYGINIICLRFFTVYGQRGRPDMAPYKFTENIIKGKPIDVFGDGSTSRDYTYVTDIVDGIIASLKELEKYDSTYNSAKQKMFEIINLGNSSPVPLKKFISIIENAAGKKAIINRMPLQQGDVPVTFADISKAQRLLGYNPKVPIEEGIRRFVEWYKCTLL